MFLSVIYSPRFTAVILGLLLVVLPPLVSSGSSACAAVGSDLSEPITVDVVAPELELSPTGGNFIVHGQDIIVFHWTTYDDHPGLLAEDFIARVVSGEEIISQISYLDSFADFTWAWQVPDGLSTVAWLEVFVYDFYGNATMVQGVTFTILPSTVGVSQDLPTKLRLAAPHPNPFNPVTNIAFEMPAAGTAELIVYDVKGRRVRTLRAGSHAAGRHEVSWDGRDDAGRRVAGEVFLAVLNYACDGRNERLVRKLVYIP